MGIARSTSSQASGKGDSSAADSRQLCESAEPLKIQYVIEAQRPEVSEIRVPTKDGNASVVRHGADPPRGLEMFDGDANAPPQISEHALSELLVSGHSREVNLMGTGYTKVAVSLDVPGHHFRTLRLTDLAQPEHAHGLNAILATFVRVGRATDKVSGSGQSRSFCLDSSPSPNAAKETPTSRKQSPSGPKWGRLC